MRILPLITALAASAPVLAATPAAKPLAPSEIVSAAPQADWNQIDPRDMMVIDLAADPKGQPRQIVIQMMPPPFSQGWIGNIRSLITAGFWNGTTINRVQDNYVVQWGDAEAEDKAKAKPFPAGLAAMDQAAYVVDGIRLDWVNPVRDAYAAQTGIASGWPVARQGRKTWPVHCYGMVGVGRGMPPETGNGAELYTVIGHAPRHLDRNIALVGRVIDGMEHLSSLPRGTGPLGFYTTADQRTAITSVRLGTMVPGLPRYHYLATGSGSFARYAEARANRRDGFFIQPAGGADICNVAVPIRKSASAESPPR